MQGDSRHLYNTACPECRKRGNDAAGDNLGVYDDGHAFCWNCGYYQHADASSSIGRLAKYKSVQLVQTEAPHTALPSDCDTYIPAVARDWLGKYDLTEYELINNRVLWSEYWKQLIFPYFNKYNQLEAWQGRSFNPDMIKKHKWFSQGNLKSLYHILPLDHSSDTIIVVEDIVSAIKVSRITPAMPLFGSTVGLDRFRKLYSRFKQVRIWLDPDMRKKSLQEAVIGRQLGLDVQVIYSDKDPKEHTTEEIKHLTTQ